MKLHAVCGKGQTTPLPPTPRRPSPQPVIKTRVAHALPEDYPGDQATMACKMCLAGREGRLGEHTSWAYYLIRQKRLMIVRDPEIGLYLVRDSKKTLKQLRELLRGKRFSLTLQPRLS